MGLLLLAAVLSFALSKVLILVDVVWHFAHLFGQERFC